MPNGRRVTLDNPALKFRTRSYANSYVSRPLDHRLVSDMLPVRPLLAPVVSGQDIIDKAKSLLLDLRNTSYTIESPRSDSKVLLSAGRVSIDTLKAEKGVLDASGGSRGAGILRKSSLSQATPPPLSTRSPAPPPLLSQQPSEPLENLVSSIQQSSRTKSFDALLVQPTMDPKISSKNFVAKLSPKNIFSRTFGNGKATIMSAMAVVLFFGGVVALVSSLGNNRAVTMQAQALSDQAENSGADSNTGESSGIGDLSESEISEPVVRSYSVSPDYPKYVSIAKLGGRNSRVLRMGLDSAGSIKTPRSIWDAGWYEASSLPGDKVGAALILGHVSGPNDPGIFYNLYRLSEGDVIDVVMGDDTKYSYTVVAKEEVPVGEINMNNYLVSKNVDKPGLTIMTCAGEFNSATQQYENRLAVFAVRSN